MVCRCLQLVRCAMLLADTLIACACHWCCCFVDRCRCSMHVFALQSMQLHGSARGQARYHQVPCSFMTVTSQTTAASSHLCMANEGTTPRRVCCVVGRVFWGRESQQQHICAGRIQYITLVTCYMCEPCCIDASTKVFHFAPPGSVNNVGASGGVGW